MKIIIFGSCGQDGVYLTRLLEKQGIEVIGIDRQNTTVVGDVSDYMFVKDMIALHKPEFIFHFAALSTTKHFALFENHKTIESGALNIMESVRIHCPSTKIFLSGSAMQFVNDGSSINEQTSFEASSPYSVARIQSVYAARYYRHKLGLQVYIGYFFNHDSPLRPELHVNQKIAMAVKRIAAGSNERLVLGNIDVKKEFNFAGDVVKAVWLLVNQSDIYEAVIGCGEAHSIREWVEYCFSRINKNWQDYVDIDINFVQEYNILVSDPARIKSLGWSPEVNFTQLVDLMIGDL